MEELYQDEDFCALCSPKLREKGLAPNLLVELPTHTNRHGLEVRVCPECDGGAAILGMR